MAESMDAVRASKSRLRKTIQASLKALSEAELKRQSAQVHERLFSMPEYQSARNISVYLSMPTGEISTKPIVTDALRQGKNVFVPYIYKNQSAGPPSLMDMVVLHSEQDYDSLKPDKWGIPTPDTASVSERIRCLGTKFVGNDKIEASKEPKTLLEHLDIIVVPGVAFDLDRQRLGHGKGYYDIFFSRYHSRMSLSDSDKTKMPYLVGVALRQQILPASESVPVDSTDWRVDAVIAAENIAA